MHPSSIHGFFSGDKLTVVSSSWDGSSKREIYINNIHDARDCCNYMTREQYEAGVSPKYVSSSLIDYFMMTDLVFFGWDLPIKTHQLEVWMRHSRLFKKNEKMICLSGKNMAEIKRIIEDENLNLRFKYWRNIIWCKNKKKTYLFPEYQFKNICKLSSQEQKIIWERRDHLFDHVLEKYPIQDNRAAEYWKNNPQPKHLSFF